MRKAFTALQTMVDDARTGCTNATMGRDIFVACRGNAARIAEEIKARHGIDLAYSTQARIIREQQLRKVHFSLGFVSYKI